MAAKLPKTPKSRVDEARIDCVRLARAIIAGWPRRGINHWATEKQDAAPYDHFRDQLLSLGDRETIAMFVSKLAEQDETLKLTPFVVEACRKFGLSAFDRELKQLMPRPTGNGRAEIPLRDVEWLSAFCGDETSNPDKSALAAELCALAVERYCEPFPKRPLYWPSHQRRETSALQQSLPLLLKALATGGSDNELETVIQFVLKTPDEFSLGDCQVPALKSLIPWSRKRFGLVRPELASWLASVRHRLESATARKPSPPTDWARPAEVDCNCGYCAKLNAFLADPANEVGRIPAREDVRSHLTSMVKRHECDVTHTLERRGSPHSLVFTKTHGSYERAVERFKLNSRLLSELPAGE